MKPHFTPLPSSTMLIGLLGLFISIIYIMKRWPSFGFAFSIVFAGMVIASFLSMTYAPVNELLELDKYEQEHKEIKYHESKFMKHLDKIFRKKK